MPRVILSDGATVRLPMLRGAVDEAESVAVILRTSALTGAKATKSAVLSRASSAPVLHIATHGRVYTSAQWAPDSYLALAPRTVAGTATPSADSFLRLEDVANLPPTIGRFDLVVLSGCETADDAGGRLSVNLGFASEWMRAGARSLVVTQWGIDDLVTRDFMIIFYRQWVNGRGAISKAEALRLAMKQIEVTRPEARYWAAFRLIGAIN